MMRLNLVLLLAVLASAQHESRRLVGDLDRATADAHKLAVENDRLQVEKRAQATPMRVEKLAKDKLQMRATTPAITQYVTYAAETAQTANGTSAAGQRASGAIQ